MTTPKSLSQAIQVASTTPVQTSMTDSLCLGAIPAVPELSTTPAIPDPPADIPVIEGFDISLIPESTAIPPSHDAQPDQLLSNLELTPPSVDKESLSIPDSETLVNLDDLTAYSSKLNTITRSLLPLLIACHSNDGNLVKIALEHLHYFITAASIQLENSKEDCIIDKLLGVVYDGIIASLPSCHMNLANILIKIVHSFQVIHASTFSIILSYFSSLQIYFFGIQDKHSDKSTISTQIEMNIKTLVDLLTTRVKVEGIDAKADLASVDLKEKLTSFTYKLESTTVHDLDLFIADIQVISEGASPCENYQNFIMFYLLLLSQIRVYGSVLTFFLCESSIDLLYEDPPRYSFRSYLKFPSNSPVDEIAFMKSTQMTSINRYVTTPVLLLSISITETLNTQVLKSVLEVYRTMWMYV